MGLINCSECGNLMVDNPTKMCPNCLQAEEAAEDRVSEYLRETGKRASLEEISQATGVKTKVIFRMLQRGRLESAGSLVTYPCETCGAQISEGRLCERCSNNITSQIRQQENRQLQRKEAPKQQGKRDEQMFTKDMFGRK